MIAERQARIDANSALAVAVAMGMPELRLLSVGGAVMDVMADAGDAVKCDVPEGLLKEDAKDALEEYVTNSFGLNSGLRVGTLTAEQAALAARLDSIMAPIGGVAQVRTISGVENILYRTIPTKDAPSFLAGKTFTDKAFVSTSKSSRIAKEFAELALGDGETFVLLRIRTSKQALAVDVNVAAGDFGGFAWQEEVLLARNTRFKVNRVYRQRDGQAVIDLSVVD